MICETDAYTSLTFCDLPNDIIKTIINYLQKEYYVELKMSCKLMYKTIGVFPLGRRIQMFSKKFGIFTCRKYCINPYCCDDTYDVFHRHYRSGDSYYIHIIQLPLNETKIIINEKQIINNEIIIKEISQTIMTHYCSECFKKYVIVGDRKNIIHNYQYIDELNISYYIKN